MKITKEQLKQIIKEELTDSLGEAWQGYEADARWVKKTRRAKRDVSKDAVAYYSDMESRTHDPTAYYGEGDWPEEIQVKNKISKTMYNILLHTIPRVAGFKKEVEDLKNTLRSYTSGESQEFAEEALKVLDDHLRTIEWASLNESELPE